MAACSRAARGHRGKQQRGGASAARRPFPVRQCAVALVASVTMLSYGMAAGWSSAALPRLQASHGPDALPGGALPLDDATWLAALITVTGIPFGPLFALLSERRGRKATGGVVAALHLLGHACLAVGLPMGQHLSSRPLALSALYASRVLLGVATAGGFVFAPLYVREVADDRWRGPLGVLNTVVINVGVEGAYALGAALPVAACAAVAAAPPLLFLALLPWLPETPVFLLRRRRFPEAVRALQMLRPGEDAIVEGARAQASLTALGADEREGAVAILREMVCARAARRALLIMCFLLVNQQFSGLFCIISYASQVLEEAGSSLSPQASALVVGAMLTLGTVLSALLCNRWGRRALLVASNALMAAALAALGAYFYLKHRGQDVAPLAWVPVTSMSVFVTAFNLGIGPIILLLYTELFSPKLVSTALYITGPIPAILSFIIGKFFYTVSDLIGVYSCFWGFAGVCAVSILFILAAVPETKNRSIESIVKELEDTRPLRDPQIKMVYNPVMTSQM